MKLNEAIEKLVLAEANGEEQHWFRPIRWIGHGAAYCLKDGYAMMVPTAKGGEYTMTFMAKELIGEWEIVHPDVVLGERS